MMNSILTMEERTLLQSLGCPNAEHAVSVLEKMIEPLPIVSELFGTAFSLMEKLKGELIDFNYEMTSVDFSNDDEEIA